jgi:hypothetical protein
MHNNVCIKGVYFLVSQSYSREEELYCVYVPTNHLYIGDMFLITSSDVIRPNLSVREGIGMVVFFFFIHVSILSHIMEMTMVSAFVLYCCRDCCLRGHVNASGIVSTGNRGQPIQQDEV